MRNRHLCHASRMCCAALIGATLFASPLVATASDFTQTTGPTGGEAASISACLSDAWAVSRDSSVFHSADGGQNWTRLDTTGLPVGLWLRQIIAMSESVLLTRDSINVYRSTDGGASWSAVGLDTSNIASTNLFADGPAVAALLKGQTSADADRLHVSHDRGATWATVPLPSDGVQDVFFKDDVLVVAPETFGGLMRSLTLGDIWTPVGAELPADMYLRLAVGQPSLVLQCAFSGRVFRSTNVGQSWLEISPPFASGFLTTPLAVADGDTTMHAAFEQQNQINVYRTIDDGGTWHNTGAIGLPPLQVSSSQPLAMAATTTSLLLGYGSSELGVFRSTDGGATWSEANDGFIATSIDAVGSVGAALLASSAYFAVNHRSADGGASWLAESALPDVVCYHAVDDTTVFAGSRGLGVYRSDDAGGTWTAVNTGLPDYVAMDGGSIEPVVDLAEHDGFLFAATGGGREFIGGDDHCGCTGTTSGDGVYRSANNGATWQRVSNGLPINTFAYGEPILRPITALQPVNGALLAATPAHGVFRSTNAGSSWSATSGVPGGTDMQVFNGAVYLVDGSGAVYRSTNDGASWTMLSTDLPSGFAATRLHEHDGKLFAAAGSPAQFAPARGIYSSMNGTNWQPASAALAEIAVVDMTSHGGNMVVATRNHGVWTLADQPKQPADITGDGVVDVFDLLELLANWGADGPGADIAPPTDIVDVFDLLDLLNAWTTG